jgi:hypothetical protein
MFCKYWLYIIYVTLYLYVVMLHCMYMLRPTWKIGKPNVLASLNKVVTYLLTYYTNWRVAGIKYILLYKCNHSEIPPVTWPVKAGQDFSIYSSGSHFVQQSRTCQWSLWCATLGMVLITPVMFGWNPWHH